MALPACHPNPLVIAATTLALGVTILTGCQATAGEDDALAGPLCTPSAQDGCRELGPDAVQVSCLVSGPKTFLSINRTTTDADIRSETKLGEGFIGAALLPGGTVTIHAPIAATGRRGILTSARMEAPAPIWSRPPPPPAPNEEREDDRDRQVEALELAQAKACELAREAAIAGSADQIAAAQAELASARAIGRTPAGEPVPFEELLASAEQFFILNPDGPREGVITGVGLGDDPLPVGGLWPSLAGSRWVIVHRAGAAGADRLHRDRISGLFASNQAEVIFIAEDQAGPEQILSALRP